MNKKKKRNIKNKPDYMNKKKKKYKK